MLSNKPGRDRAGRGTEQEASRWKPEGEDFLPIFSIWKNILNLRYLRKFYAKEYQGDQKFLLSGWKILLRVHLIDQWIFVQIKERIQTMKEASNAMVKMLEEKKNWSEVSPAVCINIPTR